MLLVFVFLKDIYIYIYVCVCVCCVYIWVRLYQYRCEGVGHYHQGMPTASIALTLSHYQSLSAISLDECSKQHPVSPQSWWMTFFSCRSTLVCPWRSFIGACRLWVCPFFNSNPQKLFLIFIWWFTRREVDGHTAAAL